MSECTQSNVLYIRYGAESEPAINYWGPTDAVTFVHLRLASHVQSQSITNTEPSMTYLQT